MKSESLIIFLLIISPFYGFTQLDNEEKAKIEGYQRIIEGSGHDSLKVNALQKWDDMIYYFDADLDLDLNFRIGELCQKNLLKNITEQESYFFQRKLGNATNNIGIIYHDKGEYRKAFAFYSKGLEIREKIGNKPGIASSLNNIGTLYDDLGDYSKALEYYTRSLNIKTEIDDKSGIASSLNNIGTNYSYQEEYEEALIYYERSLEIRMELMDNHGIAQNYHNIGIVYMWKKDYELAKEYHLWSYEIFKEEGDRYGMALSLNNLGAVYKELGDINKAENYALQSMKLAEEMDLPSEIKEASKLLAEIYEGKNNYKKAYEMLERYIEMEDSLVTTETTKAILEKEFKYEAAKDSVQNVEQQKVLDAELKTAKANHKQKEQLSYFLYGVILLGVLFGGFILNRFKITTEQKKIIEEQKSQVDEAFGELENKNTEILSSISYAKRIQAAILPAERMVKKYLPDSFIIYKPKDIVAGDFYWLEAKENLVMFAAADCTGHGVPGAMVSVVCHNALNLSVKDLGITNPGLVLDRVNELVQEQFKQSVEEVNDGMDIALCTINTDTLELNFAGAHNPLWVIRDGELLETKGNKQPIGKYDLSTEFTNHKIQLEENDMIYLFTDGFADQFGGERQKKLKMEGFRQLLKSVSKQSTDNQKIQILWSFDDWKGELEQVDDVCVIGVRVKRTN